MNTVPTITFMSSLAFFKSPVFIGIAVAFILTAGAMFGRHFDAAKVTEVVNDVMNCLTLVSLGIAAYHRWASSIQPLTLTATPAVPPTIIVPVPAKALSTLGVSK
jgi:hypothetical protein